MNTRMANRILVPCFPKRKLRSPVPVSRVTQRSSISRKKLLSEISNHEIQDFMMFSKSPKRNISKHSSSIYFTKEFPASTPRVQRQIKRVNKRRKTSSKNSIGKSSLLAKFSKKTENLRYGNLDLEESCKNINGVSTPPDEEVSHQKSLSPFSEIIDEQLNIYINSPISRVSKLELPKNFLGYIEDSYQYSTADSRKKNFYKVSLDKKIKIPEPPKTPPPFSILSKIKPGNFRRSSSRNYK